MEQDTKHKKVIVVNGSRTFRDYGKLCEVLDNLIPKEERANYKIISGGAAGADQLVESYAVNNSIWLTVCIPNWKKNGKAAGMIRNKHMIDKASMLVSFWDGRSPGTKQSIEYAREKGLEVVITYF